MIKKEAERLKVENLEVRVANIKDDIYASLKDDAKLESAYSTLLDAFKDIKDQELFTLLITLHNNYKDDSKDNKNETFRAIEKLLDLHLNSGTILASKINDIESDLTKLASSNNQNTWLSKYIMPGLIILMFIWSLFRVDPEATKYSTVFTKDLIMDTREANMNETEREAKLNNPSNSYTKPAQKEFEYSGYGAGSYTGGNSYTSKNYNAKGKSYTNTNNKSKEEDDDWGDVK